MEEKRMDRTRKKQRTRGSFIPEGNGEGLREKERGRERARVREIEVLSG